MNVQKAAQRLSAVWMILMAAWCASIAPAFAQTSEDGTRLTVTAVAQVRRQPDVATISAAVDASAETAAEAEALVRDLIDRVGAALREQELPVSAGHFSIYPRYDYGGESGPIPVGFEARRQLEVTVSPVERAVEAIQILLDHGVKEIHGISYGLKDEVPARREAIRRALADAREQAESVAALSGQRILEIVTIAIDSSVHSYFSGPAMFEAGSSVAPTPATVQVSATVEYRLEPK